MHTINCIDTESPVQAHYGKICIETYEEYRVITQTCELSFSAARTPATGCKRSSRKKTLR